MSLRGGRLRVERCTRRALDDWVALRRALWPQDDEAGHRAEAAAMLDDEARMAAFLARDGGGAAVGFAEAALRTDHVNGCATSPVGFLEGLYVAPERRREGAGRLLVEAVEAWAAARGCAELASDAALDNEISHRMHEAVGFEETERVVYFRKPLRPA